MPDHPKTPKDCLGQPLPEPRGSATTDVREAHREPEEMAVPGLLVMYEDGSTVTLDSYAGGAHPAGTWGRLWLRFRAADGTETVREYMSTHPADLKQTGTIPFER